MQSSFSIRLPENLPPGVIHTTQAFDPDQGENGTIYYSLLGKELLLLQHKGFDLLLGSYTPNVFV